MHYNHNYDVLFSVWHFLKDFFFTFGFASLDGCERVSATRVREVFSNKLKRTGLE